MGSSLPTIPDTDDVADSELPSPEAVMEAGIRALAHFQALARGELDAFLDQQCLPVLVTGPLASARLDDPTCADELTVCSPQPTQAPGQVIPVRARSKARAGDREVWLGRGTGCDVLLPFATVSRVHARLSADARGHLMLSDAGSRNGTWVNGLALPTGQAVQLKDGDAIRLGSLELRFLMPETLYWHLRPSEGAEEP